MGGKTAITATTTLIKEEITLAKKGKKYQDAVKLVDREENYDVNEAIELVKKAAPAKFDETVEVAVRLGVDVKKG